MNTDWPLANAAGRRFPATGQNYQRMSRNSVGFQKNLPPPQTNCPEGGATNTAGVLEWDLMSGTLHPAVRRILQTFATQIKVKVHWLK